MAICEPRRFGLCICLHKKLPLLTDNLINGRSIYSPARQEIRDCREIFYISRGPGSRVNPCTRYTSERVRKREKENPSPEIGKPRGGRSKGRAGAMRSAL